MRWILMALGVILVMVAIGLGGDDPAPRPTWGGGNTPAVIDADGPPTLAPLKTKTRRGLSFRERRAAGVTFRNVAKKLAEMQEDGSLEELDSSARAAEVLRRIQADDPKALMDACGDRDWTEFFSALLAFIEKIIPIILMIFGGL